MVQRTIQEQSGSYITVLPKAIVEAVGIKPGDKISFGIDGRKIILIPVQSSCKSAEQVASDP